VYVGGIVVPGNAWWSREEVAHAVETVSPALAVTDDEGRQLLPPDLPTLPVDELQGFYGEADETERVLPAPVGEDDPARRELRDDLVRGHLDVARNLARKFDRRGEPLDDLVQVATVGLIK